MLRSHTDPNLQLHFEHQIQPSRLLVPIELIEPSNSMYVLEYYFISVVYDYYTYCIDHSSVASFLQEETQLNVLNIIFLRMCSFHMSQPWAAVTQARENYKKPLRTHSYLLITLGYCIATELTTISADFTFTQMYYILDSKTL